MKKLKSILLLTLCLAMVVTTITVPSDHNTFIPNGHFEDKANGK